MSTPPALEIYQLRFYVKGISPMIWRRLQLRSDSSLADLHYAIQIVMNWSNYYLHRFTIHGKSYAVWRPYALESYPAKDFRLQDLKLRLNQRFLYEYNFFDCWQLELRLEKHLPLDEKKHYPICVAASRAAPAENCGGAIAFMERQAHYSPFYMLSRIVEIIEHLISEDAPDEDERDFYQAELRNFDYWMNVEKLDRREINQRLKWYSLADERWAEYLEVL